MNSKDFMGHLKNNIIPFWNALEDKENGGFYGYVDGKGVVNKKANKGVILNNRILWFYSNAYILLKDEVLLQKAKHAFEFMLNACIDSEFGGVFWSVSYDGKIVDDIKHCYNQAFALYSLCSFYEASGNKEALNQAYKLFNIIEEKCHDEKGYLEAFYRDFTKAENDKLSENGVMAERTMNTLLHLLEAYTQLYKVDKSEKVKERLQIVMKDFKEKIYNPKRKICNVFFDDDYNSIIDLESYGHDIEASWLISRACQILYDSKITESMQNVICELAEGAFEHGFDKSLNAMNNECERGVVNTTKIWWVQAESVIGFYNLFQLNPEKIMFKEASENTWKFICDYVIDKKSGEWIENIYDIDKIDDSQALVHPWKCPYHNGRMCLEMIKRLGE